MIISIKDAVDAFKKYCDESKVKYYNERISYTGSTYLMIKYKGIKNKVRISNHHENSRTLPKYNILVGYEIEPNTESRSSKRYYNEHQIQAVVTDFIRSIDRDEE